MTKKRRGPTPSREARERHRLRTASLKQAFPREREWVQRVRCEGCGVGWFSRHARGDDPSGEPRYVEPCSHCGSETATHVDWALAPAGMFESAPPGVVRSAS